MEMMGLVASCRLVLGMILLDLEDSLGLVAVDLADVAVVALGDLEDLVEAILYKCCKSELLKDGSECMIMTKLSLSLRIP